MKTFSRLILFAFFFAFTHSALADKAVTPLNNAFHPMPEMRNYFHPKLAPPRPIRAYQFGRGTFEVHANLNNIINTNYFVSFNIFNHTNRAWQCSAYLTAINPLNMTYYNEVFAYVVHPGTSFGLSLTPHYNDYFVAATYRAFCRWL